MWVWVCGLPVENLRKGCSAEEVDLTWLGLELGIGVGLGLTLTLTLSLTLGLTLTTPSCPGAALPSCWLGLGLGS